MPQTFTLGPTTANQDKILLHVATKRGKTVDELVNEAMTDIFQRAKKEYEQDEGARVADAYNAANTATQNGIKTALGLV